MNKYDVIGLMSGTSLDGLDIAYVEFIYDRTWNFEIKNCNAVKYSSEMLAELKQSSELSGLELKKLDLKYGKWLGEQVQIFIDKHKISPELIVSHGHTVFHQPEIGLTYQIGDGNQILKSTGIRTICDLRSKDVALGGQGAPLVPIGDMLLFGSYHYCLNLGGFSNISFDKKDKRTAYDICPVNAVLNYLASHADLEFDRGGELAQTGIINESLLNKLNSLEYYGQNPPKSLGIEWVQQNIFPLLVDDTTENLLNTYCHHISDQITSSIRGNRDSLVYNNRPNMLVTGGGTKNNFLMDLMKQKSKNEVEIVIPSEQLIDYKEALIFAFLGLLRLLGEINTLRSVTGAKANSSGGIVYEI